MSPGGESGAGGASMELMLFKTLWGHAGSHAEAVGEALAAGFQGIEGQVPPTAAERRELAALLAGHGAQYIAEITTAGGYVPARRAGVARHLEAVETALAGCEDGLEPLFLTCIGGCDAWPLDDSLAFFEGAMGLAARAGRVISFETHRSRSLFTPWITRQVVAALPEIRLTCDFSHWCVVCERLLDTELDVIAAIAPHAHHVHARVGYDQGPQVPHPGAPEYAGAVAAHQRWWETLWAAQAEHGYAVTTMTPEFGPDGYLHELPYTRAPVADLWALNRWMGATERAHFARWRAGAAPEESQP